MDNFGKKWFITLIIKQSPPGVGCKYNPEQKLYCMDCLEEKLPIYGISCLDDKNKGVANIRVVCKDCLELYPKA